MQKLEFNINQLGINLFLKYASMTNTPQKHSSIPLYMQISEALMRDIAAGRYIDGERLLPERQLAKQLGTTVKTLRKALEILEDQGNLERIQGSGNYVRSTEASQTIYSMFRLELHSGGGLPTAKIISVDYMEKPETLPQFGKSNMGSRIRRLRYLDDIPIAVEEIWLDGSVGPVKESQLSDSLYRFYRMELGFWISRAEDRVGLGEVPNWAPDDFEPSVGTKVGFISRNSWAQAPEQIEFSYTWFDTKKALYVQRIK